MSKQILSHTLIDPITKLTIAETLEVVYLLDYPVNIKFYPFEVDCSEDTMTIKLPNNLGVWKIEKAEGRQLKTTQATGLFTTFNSHREDLDFQSIAYALDQLDCNLRKIRSHQGLIQLFLESDIHN